MVVQNKTLPKQQQKQTLTCSETMDVAKTIGFTTFPNTILLNRTYDDSHNKIKNYSNNDLSALSDRY